MDREKPRADFFGRYLARSSACDLSLKRHSFLPATKTVLEIGAEIAAAFYRVFKRAYRLASSEICSFFHAATQEEMSVSKKGPFGLWVGMQAHDIGVALEEIAPYKFRTSSPPKPHSAFELYVLQITPKAGLSWIKAIGKTVATNGFGYELQTVFKDMEGKLCKSYGKNSRNELLLTGSIWNEPRDWMQGLQKRERFLSATWDEKSGSNMPDGLSSLYLGATALDTDSGFIGLEYSLENHSESDAEIAAAEDDVL